MALLYRSVFEINHADAMEVVSGAFSSWIIEKSLGVEAPKVGTASKDDVEINVVRADAGELRAARFVLHEEQDGARWSTTVTVMERQDDRRVWIDLERVSADPYGKPPTVGAPGVVRLILTAADCHAGPTALSNSPLNVDAAGVQTLVQNVLDPDRAVPIVVLSKDRFATTEAATQRAEKVLAKILGLAPVFVMDAEATTALNEVLGSDLAVFGGAVRTYLPDLTVPDRQPKRHPYVAGTIFASQPGPAASRIQRSIAQQAIAQRPPALYRDGVASLPGFPHHVAGAHRDEELVDEMISLEAERDELATQVRELEEQVGYADLQLDEKEAEIDSKDARIRYLENRLRSANDEAANLPTPLSTVPETTESCREAIDYARQYLSNVEIGDTEFQASALDTYPKSGAWGKKAWRVFRAMDDYADLKSRDEFAGDFLAYCAESPQGRTVVPEGWVALKESESTDNNPKYRSARTFAVPFEVSEEEEVYMCAHIKLEAGGKPAPRIHFHDDTSGETGSIYIGYFGEHLPNDQTN